MDNPESSEPTDRSDRGILQNADLRELTFTPDDATNPRNWSPRRKWLLILVITILDCSVSWGASGYSPATMKLEKDFNVSAEVGTLGLSIFVLGLALGPMVIAPLSEYYGRTPLYLVPYGIYCFFLLGTALVKNIGGFLVLRFFSGLFASVTIANFGGTIADLWPRHEQGLAMSVFLWAAVCGSPMGFFLLSFVAGTRPWRDVFWALLGMSGGIWILTACVLLIWPNETRHSVILRRRADRVNREAGAQVVTVPEEMRAKGLTQLFQVTLSRPFRFLSTEAIVMFAALYNGYLYGLSFLFNGAFGLVFGPKGYGFSTIGVGLTFLGLIVGISIGPFTNLWQERHYQRKIRPAQPPSVPESSSSPADDVGGLSSPAAKPTPLVKNIPEARLQTGFAAAVALPVSLFWFAWTCLPAYHIHWIVPVLATALFGWSFYTLILMSYLYVEDSYLTYSASALAGVGLIRNLAGAGFPLFGTQLFTNEGYNWGGSILAFLACLLVPIPFVLARYGKRLRAKSPFARQHMGDDGDEDEQVA